MHGPRGNDYGIVRRAANCTVDTVSTTLKPFLLGIDVGGDDSVAGMALDAAGRPIMAGTSGVSMCTAGDVNGDEQVTINEILKALRLAWFARYRRTLVPKAPTPDDPRPVVQGVIALQWLHESAGRGIECPEVARCR